MKKYLSLLDAVQKSLQKVQKAAAASIMPKINLKSMLASGFQTLKTQVGAPIYASFKSAYSKAADLTKTYGRKVADSWVGKIYTKARAPFVPTAKPPPAAGQPAGQAAEKGDEGSKFSDIVGKLTAIGEAGIAAAQVTSKAFETIRTKTGATAANMGVLMDSFRTVGSQVPQSLDAVAGTIGILHKASGATQETLNVLAKTTLDLSRVMGTDSTATAEAASKAMKAWGITGQDGTKMLDLFFAASRKADVGINELMGQMGTVGEPMQKLGLSFEQSMALLANWQKQGLNPIEDALKKPLPAGGLAEVARQIKAAGSAADAARIATELFGEAAGTDLVKALRDGTIESKGVMEAMQGSQGAIQSYESSVQSFSDRWDVLKNNMTLAMAPIGELILPVGEQLLALFNFLKTNADFLVPAFAAMGAVLLGVLAPSLWASAVAGWAAMAPFLPLIGILALVGLAVGAIAYVITRKMDWIKEKLTAVWKWITETVGKMKSAVGGWFGSDSTAPATVQGNGDATQTATAASGLQPSASLYSGLDYVPYDGMIARLHKGERVMTAQENRALTQGAGGVSVSITGNTFNVRQDADIDAIARALVREIKAAGGLMA